MAIDAPTFPAEAADEIDEAIEHTNAQHPDSILFVVRHVEGQPTGDSRPLEAEIAAIDPLGVDFAVVDGIGRRTARLAFAEATLDPAVLQAQLFGVLLEAREAVGDSVPLTSLERSLAEDDGFRTFSGRVLGRRSLTSQMLEVRLGGFEGFAPLGPDTFVWTMVRTDGDGIAGDFSMADWQVQEATEGPSPVRGAYYTIREWDPGAQEMVLWVVLHEDDGDGGVARWMSRAAPGDPVVLWGPREAFVPPADASRYLLVADETGLAAVAVIVEGLAPTAQAVAVLEVATVDDAPPMPTHPGLVVHWIERGDVGPGEHGGLVEVVADIDVGDGSGWAAFGGGESRQITRVRQLLRHERGLAAAQVSMTGYWRRPTA